VHNDSGFGKPSHRAGIDDIDSLVANVLVIRRESLFLNAGLIYDIDVFDCLAEVGFVSIGDARGGQCLADIVPHGNFRGRDENELDSFRAGEQHCQRPHGAPVAQIAYEGDAQVIGSTQGVADRIEIEQCLRGMLAWTIAGIDDWHGRYRGCSRGGSLLVVPNDDCIGIAFDNTNCVFDGFALDRRGEFAGVFGRDDISTQTQHRRFEAETSSRGGFVKEGRQDESVKSMIWPGERSHAVRGVENDLEVLARKLTDFDDVSWHCFTLARRSKRPDQYSERPLADRWYCGKQREDSMTVEFLTERVGYIPGAVNAGVVRAEDDRFILIDTGLNDASGKKAIKAIQELGGSVAAIVTTHAHADHFGANATVVKRTGARVFAPAIDEAIIRYPILQPSLLYAGADPPAMLRGRFLLADASPVDEVFDGETIVVEGIPMQVIGLAGHSPNQKGILVEGIFFSADVALPESVLEKYRIPYLYAVGNHLRAIDTAKAVEADWVVPGHGSVSRDILDALEVNRALVLDVANRVLEFAAVPAPANDLMARVLESYDAPVSDHAAYFLLHPTIYAFLSYLHGEGALESAVEEYQTLWWRV
jgi:glyoxylase-like metal-dependent hydrolase (beta-lactamase superfamily II)